MIDYFVWGWLLGGFIFFMGIIFGGIWLADGDDDGVRIAKRLILTSLPIIILGPLVAAIMMLCVVVNVLFKIFTYKG